LLGIFWLAKSSPSRLNGQYFSWRKTPEQLSVGCNHNW